VRLRASIWTCKNDSCIDLLALKQRAFERILSAEEDHLVHSGELISGLRRAATESGSLELAKTGRRT
jgi:hypothetical protein